MAFKEVLDLDDETEATAFVHWSRKALCELPEPSLEGRLELMLADRRCVTDLWGKQ